MGGQIGDGQRLEGACADYGLECQKVLGERAEDAEPVLAVVDLQPLEGGEAAVRGDERLGHGGHGAAVGGGGAHLFVRREGKHDGGGHLALKLGQAHGQGTHFAASASWPAY